MNDGERQQIDRLSARAKDRSVRDFAAQLKIIYADHSAKGLLRSGATIKAAIRQMEASIRQEMTSLLDEVGAVSRSEDAYAEIVSTVQAILAAVAEELPNVIRLAGQGPGSRAGSAALDLYYTMKSDIEADLVIARHGFVSGEVTPPVAASPAKNRGGKPLAAHWDEMWADIAVQLWNGDLSPRKQADIKRAMDDWFITNKIEVGDTAVIERARRLWQKIEAAL